MKIKPTIIATAIAFCAMSFALSSAVQASTIKHGNDGNAYICASSDWSLRYLGTAKKSGIKLKRGECVQLIKLDDYANYVQVQGVNG